MKLSSLLSSLTKKRSTKANDRTPSFRRRFMLEALEERRVLATLIVTNTGDSDLPNSGSLRSAILAANQSINILDTIEFKIDGPGVHTISPLAELPIISDPVVINGYTQAGAMKNTNGPGLGDNAVLQIELDGSNISAPYVLAPFAVGLIVSAGNSTIQGLAINRFDGFGIWLKTNGGNNITGNFIGTDSSGAVAKGNTLGGLYLNFDSADNTIGGLSEGSRNIISGNDRTGIQIDFSNRTIIEGNFIGTDATGTKALSTASGFRSGIFDQGNSTRIGGTLDSARNIISGNNGKGVEVYLSINTTVQGNYIGTDVTGKIAVANVVGFSGFPAVSATSQVIGNVISGNTNTGLDLFRGIAQGNLIGTDYTGHHAIHNGQGVAMGEATLGGTTIAARNIISGNLGFGLRVFSNSIVQGNYFGTDITGLGELRNGEDNIFMANISRSLIGGATAGARNVFGGGDFGIRVLGCDTISIQGNFIGTDATGNHVIPGRFAGVEVGSNSTNTKIGGSNPGEGNVIGGYSSGITLGNSSGSIIQGNSIGVGADGHTPVSNGYGIGIFGGSTNNLIGGTMPGEGNVIAENSSVGITMSQYYLAPITTGNAILGNSMYNNYKLGPNDPMGLGIDINRQKLGQGADGPNTNDPGDGDIGNNDLQNYPVLTNVINGSGSTTIQGTLNSTPNSTFRVEFFSNSTVKVNGYSEGEHYLGFTPVTTDASGNASFNVTLTTPSTSGMYISSTATNSGNNTSEFSLAFQAPINSPPTANAGGPYIVGEGTNLQLNGSGSFDPDGNLQTYEWDLDYNGIAFHVNASGVQPNVSFPDNFATRMIALRVTDSGGLSNIATTTLAVSNVVPIATASGSTTGVSNQPLPFSFLATDLSSVDTAAGFRFNVNWGDNSASVFTGVTTTATTHAFAVGTYNVTMTATDKDGGVSDIKTITVTITPYAFITDPCDANKTALVIGGTSGNDQIKVNPGGGSADIKFIVNGLSTTVSPPTGHIIVYAGAGNDTVQVAGGITIPSLLFGGDGNDTIDAGNGASVLIGGDGNDTLRGGNSNDILIGGKGIDNLSGVASDDVLIGGTTSYDDNTKALCALLDEWSQTGVAYSSRVDHLLGVSTGLNGSYLLNDRTVFDDLEANTLSGTSGTDLFFQGAYDILSDATNGERRVVVRA